MTIIKPAATWLLTQLRKELTIQKPPARLERQERRAETRQERIFSTGMSAFTGIVVTTIIMAILIL